MQPIQTLKRGRDGSKAFFMGLEWTGPVSVPSDKNSLYGQSATRWLVASVSQSIIDQAIYIPFLCLKVLGAKGLIGILL